MKTLGEIGLTTESGQIISRVIADIKKNDVTVDRQRKTIVAKTVGKGIIDKDNIVFNNYRTTLDEKRLTKDGDIVMKMSAPYCAALIDEDNEGMLVSSFCSIIRDVPENIDKKYLVAYLNSDECEKQLDKKTAGSALSIITIAKLMEISIPVPTIKKQKEIGEYFEKTIKKREILNKIQKLEEEKLASMIAEIKD